MQITFPLAGNGQRLVILGKVMDYLEKFRQTKSGMPEAGGQLFFKLVGNEIRICRATGPYVVDDRRPFGFLPNKEKQTADIKALFKEGLDFLGDWHTHPQKEPVPSQMDLDSMNECFAKSKHELDSFVMLILGTASGSQGLWVSLHYKDGNYLRLLPEQSN